jgi:hypothetical protein
MTAKLNDVDPLAWLADVLARINAHPARALDTLLPWNESRSSHPFSGCVASPRPAQAAIPAALTGGFRSTAARRRKARLIAAESPRFLPAT